MHDELVALELKRLTNQEVVIPSASLGIVNFYISCDSDSDSVIDRTKEVMTAIDLHSDTDRWEDDQYWTAILPQWLIESFAPEMTEEQEQQWLIWWQSLTPEEKIEDEENRRWTLLNWMYWFEPGNRKWYWWDAKKKTENSFQFEALVDDWPFPWGSLKWLLKAAGANSIESE